MHRNLLTAYLINCYRHEHNKPLNKKKTHNRDNHSLPMNHKIYNRKDIKLTENQHELKRYGSILQTTDTTIRFSLMGETRINSKLIDLLRITDLKAFQNTAAFKVLNQLKRFILQFFYKMKQCHLLHLGLLGICWSW